MAEYWLKWPRTGELTLQGEYYNIQLQVYLYRVLSETGLFISESENRFIVA